MFKWLLGVFLVVSLMAGAAQTAAFDIDKETLRFWLDEARPKLMQLYEVRQYDAAARYTDELYELFVRNVEQTLGGRRAAERAVRGSLVEQERKQRQSLEQRRKSADHDTTELSDNLMALARTLVQLGRYDEAAVLLERAAAIEKDAASPDPSRMLRVLDAQAMVAFSRGHFGEAETLLQDVLGNAEEATRPVLDRVRTRNRLGLARYARNQLVEAGSAIQDAATLLDKSNTKAPVDGLVLKANLAALATAQGNLASATEGFAEVVRGFGAMSTAGRVTVDPLELTSPLVGFPEIDIARAAAPHSARLAAARSAERLISASARLLGEGRADRRLLLALLNNLATLSLACGDPESVERLYGTTFVMGLALLGPRHPYTAAAIANLPLVAEAAQRPRIAEGFGHLAVAAARRAGDSQVLVASSAKLGRLLSSAGEPHAALPYYLEAVATLDILFAQTRGLQEEARYAFLRRYSDIYSELIELLLMLHAEDPETGYDRQILEVVSRRQSRVFSELLRQADVTDFSGDANFLALRSRQDELVGRLATLAEARSSARALDDPAGEASLAKQISQAEQELSQIQGQLWQDYPRYMELTGAKPVHVEQLQGELLHKDEAMLVYATLPARTLLFRITPRDFKMIELAVGETELARSVGRVRRLLASAAATGDLRMFQGLKPDALNRLYEELVAPAEPLPNATRLWVVADGPLFNLPLEMLVSRFEDEDREAFEAARQAADGSPDKPLLGEYGTLSYLNDRCRLAYLPSLSALVSLRSYPKPAEPPRLDLVSFADPRFSVESSESQSGYSAATRHSLAVLARGIGDLHARLSPLPDTADEARAIAVLVGGTQRVFLRDEAREDRLKALSAQGDLKGLRYLHFATHGLLGGDYRAETRFSPPAATRTAAEGAALRPQPALALSLVGNLEGEDGFLTMREVIEELDMDLDLALLSACNTAGERVEQGRGEGFLGLTRAFLYSGAREVLVSHWSVDSAATRALMTTLFENLSMGSEAESADTAQALADAREALSMTQTVPTGANGLHVSRGHPYFWAPFVVVGAQR